MDNLDFLPRYQSSSDDDSTSKNLSKVAKQSDQQSFSQLSLVPELLQAIQENAFEHPSRVQTECIPIILAGGDLLCQAKAGMGKTAVFVFGVLNMLEEIDQVQCLVIGHTRELVMQIGNEFDRFKVHFKKENGEEMFESKVFVGGVPYKLDQAYLGSRKPQIVVGTAGRVRKLVDDGLLDLGNLKYFVIDECDQALGNDNLDMRLNIQKIFLQTPQSRQVLMFTATLPDYVRELCKKYMQNPVEVLIDRGKNLQLDALKQYSMLVPENLKLKTLVDFLDGITFNQVLVFVKNTKRAKTLAKVLNNQGFPTTALHGDLRSGERVDTIKNIKSGSQLTRVIVGTDLCGRGMDFKGVNVVVNFDMPVNEDMYMHRVGRAGRFGTKGLTLSLVVGGTDDGEVLQKIKDTYVEGLRSIETLQGVDDFVAGGVL